MERKKIITIVAAVILVAAVGVLAYMQSAKAPSPQQAGTPAGQEPVPTSTQPAPSSTGQNAAPAGPTEYTMAQIALHATAASCWSAVNGGVYDLTNWISKHPGGEKAILGLCGRDGSAAFNGQHGGMKQAESALASFKIGVLVK